MVFALYFLVPAAGALGATGPGADTNPEAYEHYVSFDLRVNSLPPDYAYDLFTRGEPGDGTLWVYTVYMLGRTSEWRPGTVGVMGRCTVGTAQLDWVSPLSYPLSPGKDYHIVWRYNRETGGELFVNGVSQGPAVFGTVDSNLSTSFHTGEVMYTGTGRRHSLFDGTIANLYRYDRDLDAGPAPGSPGPGVTLTKSVSPVSPKSGTDVQVMLVLTNAGTEPVHDIEVVDTIPPEMTVVSGETHYSLPGVLAANDSRTFRYTVRASVPGRYSLGPATAMFAGTDGNYRKIASGSPAVAVMKSLIDDRTDPVTSFFTGIGKNIGNVFRNFFG